MFEGPEYQSYIALCRELRLERKRMDEGDWFWYPGDDNLVAPGIRSASAYHQRYNSDPEWRWLPRLDQILDMLEALGKRDIGLTSDNTAEALPGEYAIGTWAYWDGGLIYKGNGPTREEAGLKLWVALTAAKVP